MATNLAPLGSLGGSPNKKPVQEKKMPIQDTSISSNKPSLGSLGSGNTVPAGVNLIKDTSVSSSNYSEDPVSYLITETNKSVPEETKEDVTGLSARLQRAYENISAGDDQPVADTMIGGLISPFSQMPDMFPDDEEGDRSSKLLTDEEAIKKETARLVKEAGMTEENAQIRAESKAIGDARTELEEQTAEDLGYDSRDEYVKKEIVPLILEEFEGKVEGSVREDLGTSGKQKNPIMAAAFKAAPVWSYNTLMGFSDLMNRSTAGGMDFLEERLEDLNPLAFKAINVVVNLGPKRNAKNAKELANDIGDAMGSALEFSESLPFVGAIMPIKTAGMKAYSAAAKNINRLEKIDAIDARRANYGGAELATMEAAETARVLANSKATSTAGKQVTEDMIDAFETKINEGRAEGTEFVIHKLDEKGKKVLDDDAARSVGDAIAEEVYTAQSGTVRGFLTGDNINAGIGEYAHLATGSDSIMKPILNSNKFNAIIAVATDLKAKNPKAFGKPRYITKVDKNGQTVLDKNGKPKKVRDPKQISVIDELYQLTVSKDMMAGEELVDLLNDYGLSFEDYVLTVVGSGSEAGKVLQKLSVIKRSRPQTELADAQQKALIDAQKDFRNALMRFEGVRRGLLVSQVATAARNLTSAGVRAPLEGLGNVMDEALYQTTQGNYGRALKSLSPVKVKRIEMGKGIKGYVPLASSENWKNSFRHMKYMFSEPDMAKGYTDLILGQPQLAKQFDMMFNNLNEIQKSTGRGSGGKLDYVLSGLEDATDILNTPNRWQEYLIRRGQFFGELERLTKREYGIDLIDTLQDGKLRDLLNDAGGFKPEGKPSFLELVDQSTKKALDVTYAKQPDIPVFRSITSFITRNGLTVVAPFPRFMFNSMELMGQYAGGAFFPLSRKLTSLVTLGKVGGKPLTPKDRQRISRNLVGMAMVGAAYQYRTSDEAPADYKQFGVGDNTEMDTTPQFPVRQYLYMGETAKRLMEGTYTTWFDPKEFTETFAGTNLRQGTTNSILEEMAALAEGSTDLTKGETLGKTLGGAVGNYFATWVTPFSQLIEAQRAGLSTSGTRGLDYKEMGSDPTLDFTASLLKAGQKPFKKYMITPQEEAELPPRLTMFGGVKSRVSPLSRVALGINLSTRDKPAGEYLERLGFQDWKLGSTSRVPSIRNAENAHFTEIMPKIVEAVKQHEVDLRKIYKEQTKIYKDDITEEEDITIKLRNLASEQFKAAKAEIRGAGLAGLSPYVRNLIAYRRISKDYRVEASQRFFSQENRKGGQRLPDPTNKDDLAELVVIAKAAKDAKKVK